MRNVFKFSLMLAASISATFAYADSGSIPRPQLTLADSGSIPRPQLTLADSGSIPRPQLTIAG